LDRFDGRKLSALLEYVGKEQCRNMNACGSIPDRVSVVIGFPALLLIKAEREKLILRKRNVSASDGNNPSSVNYKNKVSAIAENNVDIRAELYSRIFDWNYIWFSTQPYLLLGFLWNYSG
jgi:hypothetical protein